MTNPFNEDYFLRGKQTGISNYENYQWMPERTTAFAQALVNALGMSVVDSFLDFGCARGYTVKAMRKLGIDAWGFDISEWAIANCDPEVKDRVFSHMPPHPVDYVLMKDVAEHIPVPNLMAILDQLISTTRKSILIIVPLSHRYEGDYVREEDNMDRTHLLRWPLGCWMEFLSARIEGDEWTLQGSWHIPGLKPTSLTHPKSCGFLTLRRTSQC